MTPLMRMRPDQIELLANYLIHHAIKDGGVVLKKEDSQVVGRIVSLITQNFEEEAKLNEEASRLLEQNKRKIALQIDEDRAYQMIRKQLAKNRGFVL